jgi:uncharacterized protein
MKTVDEYIDILPSHQSKLVQLLREMIIHSVPGVVEKLSYKIPVYHYFGMFMYMNAVRDGVDVGFCRGKDLLDTFPQLSIKNRAIMATVFIASEKDIARYQLSEIIFTAADWNREAKQLGIKLTNRKKKG